MVTVTTTLLWGDQTDTTSTPTSCSAKMTVRYHLGNCNSPEKKREKKAKKEKGKKRKNTD